MAKSIDLQDPQDELCWIRETLIAASQEGLPHGRSTVGKLAEILLNSKTFMAMIADDLVCAAAQKEDPVLKPFQDGIEASNEAANVAAHAVLDELGVPKGPLAVRIRFLANSGELRKDNMALRKERDSLRGERNAMRSALDELGLPTWDKLPLSDADRIRLLGRESTSRAVHEALDELGAPKGKAAAVRLRLLGEERDNWRRSCETLQSNLDVNNDVAHRQNKATCNRIGGLQAQARGLQHSIEALRRELKVAKDQVGIEETES